jgi:hypothetical protein
MEALEIGSRAFARHYANEIGRRYGVLSATFALAQVVVSATTGLAHKNALIIALHQAKAHFDNGFDPSLIIVPLLTSAITCLIGGGLALAASYYAGREATRVTQSNDAGLRAGIITAIIGGATWIGASIIAAFLTGTDSTLIAVDPLDSTGIVLQDLGITLIVAVRALICAGLILLIVQREMS